MFLMFHTDHEIKLKLRRHISFRLSETDKIQSSPSFFSHLHKCVSHIVVENKKLTNPNFLSLSKSRELLQLCSGTIRWFNPQCNPSILHVKQGGIGSHF